MCKKIYNLCHEQKEMEKDQKQSKAKQEERCIAVELLWNAQYKREDREREKERQA